MDAKAKKTLVDAAQAALAGALLEGNAGAAHSYALTLGLVDGLPVDEPEMHPTWQAIFGALKDPPQPGARKALDEALDEAASTGDAPDASKASGSGAADLLRALDVFTATVGAYAPGSHREAVVLEVGDTAFRAFERALDERHKNRMQEPPPRGPYRIELHTPSGRVVIRNRAAPEVSGTCSVGEVSPDVAQYWNNIAEHNAKVMGVNSAVRGEASPAVVWTGDGVRVLGDGSAEWFGGVSKVWHLVERNNLLEQVAKALAEAKLDARLARASLASREEALRQTDKALAEAHESIRTLDHVLDHATRPLTVPPEADKETQRQCLNNGLHYAAQAVWKLKSNHPEAEEFAKLAQEAIYALQVGVKDKRPPRTVDETVLKVSERALYNRAIADLATIADARAWEFRIKQGTFHDLKGEILSLRIEGLDGFGVAGKDAATIRNEALEEAKHALARLVEFRHECSTAQKVAMQQAIESLKAKEAK